MTRNTKLKLKTLFAVLSLLLICSGSWAEDAIEFSATDLSGESVNLNELRGQWVLVNYWATWCKPCRKEIPELDELHHQQPDLFVLGLAMDESDEETLADFARELGATYPIVKIDPYDPPSEFGMPQILPTTILLDPNGEIKETISGPVTASQIECMMGKTQIECMMEEKAGS